MKKQRGFETVKALVLLALILAVVGAIAGAVHWVSSKIHAYGESEYQRGKAEAMALWQKEALQAAAEDTQAAADRHKVAQEQAKGLQDANARAAAAEDQLRKERAKHEHDQPSTVVEGCTQQPTADGAAPSHPGVHFTWSFVRDYDAAWTASSTGEPLFLDRPGAEGETAAPGAASPYGPDELAGVHERNAGKCSKAIRQLNKLIDTLDELEKREDQRASGAPSISERLLRR